MDYFIRIVRGGVGYSYIVAAVALVSLMLLMVSNVVVRFWGGVIVGTYEVVELIAAVLGGFAIAFTAFTGGHVIIKVLTSKFSPRVLAITQIFTTLISLGIWIVAVWAGTRIATERLIGGEVTGVLHIPVGPFRYIFALGLFLLCLVTLTDILMEFRKTVIK